MNSSYVLFLTLFIFSGSLCSCNKSKQPRVFDVHLHGDTAPEKQLNYLKANGVYSIAVSSSWDQQQQYVSDDKLRVLHGLMVPCPNGKVPYSLQACFEDGREWPAISWVEKQIQEKRIDFIGEVLTQYHGISASDSAMFPYYVLAEKYSIPVGIHTGSAGPDHGCPDFKEEMGNPELISNLLSAFPKLRVWMMHGGGPYIKECVDMLKNYSGLYVDISVLNNPEIVPPAEFSAIMKKMIDAGLEDRILFGSDNADISKTIAAVNNLEFLTTEQKEKILSGNSERFFRIR